MSVHSIFKNALLDFSFNFHRAAAPDLRSHLSNVLKIAISSDARLLHVLEVSLGVNGVSKEHLGQKPGIGDVVEVR